MALGTSGAASTAVEPLLKVEGLSVEFDINDEWRRVVDDVSFTINPGETMGLVGESGSGKTVTSMAIMGLLSKRISRISSGRIDFEGTDLLTLPEKNLTALCGDRISMIFQEPMTSLNPAFTVGEQIAESVRRHRKVSRKQAKERAVQALSDVGISAAERRVNAYPYEFSGGMRQRVMIAMALCCEPRLLLADEPTTALDVTIQAQVLDLLHHMRDTLGMSILFVTHDLGVIADIADRVAVMYAGQVVERGAVIDTFEAPSHPYTRALLRAMPMNAGDDGRSALYSIPGSPPTAGAFPAGCRFAPRCDLASDACEESEIALLAHGERDSRCIKIDETLALQRSQG
ncbi:MAG: ABC transporter ATP-binding protein [Cumulibacter sp.]